MEVERESRHDAALLVWFRPSTWPISWQAMASLRGWLNVRVRS